MTTPTETRQTELAALDASVARVARQKETWVQVGIAERAALLRRAIAGVLEVAEEWVRAACAAKGLDPQQPAAGEEWVSGPMTTVRNLRLLAEALDHGGAPPPVRLRSREDGQLVADVFPQTRLDRLVYSGMRVEVWIEPGQPASQGALYREKAQGVHRPGRVALVLGAGNVSPRSMPSRSSSSTTRSSS